MCTIKNLFISMTAFIFLCGSVNAARIAQECPNKCGSVNAAQIAQECPNKCGSVNAAQIAQECPNNVKSNAANVGPTEQQKTEHQDQKKKARDQEIDREKPVETIVDEKVTITDKGEYVETEVLTATKRTVRKIALPEDAIKEAARARKAAHVIDKNSNMWKQGIPDGLLKNAKAVAVFPNVVKGAIGFGGRWGKGLASVRDACGNWMAPSFVNITGGSFGFQIGVQATDLILIFTDKDAAEALLKGKFKLGADASAAAGPVGRNAEVGTDVLLKSPIYSYSHAKGLFIGVALNGAAITIDDSSNNHAYSRHIHGEEILRFSEVEVNSVVEPFITALNNATGMGDENQAASVDE